jgi:hypothetical protein
MIQVSAYGILAESWRWHGTIRTSDAHVNTYAIDYVYTSIQEQLEILNPVHRIVFSSTSTIHTCPQYVHVYTINEYGESGA